MNKDNRSLNFEELFAKVLSSLPFQKQSKVLALSTSQVGPLACFLG